MISKKQKIDNKRLSLVLSATKVYTIFHTSNKKSKLFISPLLFYLSQQAPASHPAAANDLMTVPTGGKYACEGIHAPADRHATWGKRRNTVPLSPASLSRYPLHSAWNPSFEFETLFYVYLLF